jgi:uncharacterized DUF497 family protein
MVEHLPVFGWDAAKAQTNWAKHKVRFEAVIAAFLDEARIDFDVSQAGQGEARRKTVGMIRGRLFTVVYTVRGETMRIISARRANTKEVKRYDQVRARSE